MQTLRVATSYTSINPYQQTKFGKKTMSEGILISSLEKLSNNAKNIVDSAPSSYDFLPLESAELSQKTKSFIEKYFDFIEAVQRSSDIEEIKKILFQTKSDFISNMQHHRFSQQSKSLQKIIEDDKNPNWNEKVLSFDLREAFKEMDFTGQEKDIVSSFISSLGTFQTGVMTTINNIKKNNRNYR